MPPAAGRGKRSSALHENCTKFAGKPPRIRPAVSLPAVRDRRHATAKKSRWSLPSRLRNESWWLVDPPPRTNPSAILLPFRRKVRPGSHRSCQQGPIMTSFFTAGPSYCSRFGIADPACRAGGLLLLRPAGRHHAFPVRHRDCRGSHGHPPFVSQVRGSRFRQGLAQARRLARRAAAARRECQCPVRLHRACGHGRSSRFR